VKSCPSDGRISRDKVRSGDRGKLKSHPVAVPSTSGCPPFETLGDHWPGNGGPRDGKAEQGSETGATRSPEIRQGEFSAIGRDSGWWKVGG
jgi:hypothetical protein